MVVITLLESYVNYSGVFLDVNLKKLTKEVLAILEEESSGSFSKFELEYEVYIEEGSLKLKSRIKVAVNVLIICGGLRGCVQYAYDDAMAVSQWVSTKTKSIETFRNQPITYSRSDAGDLSRIRKLLDQADGGLITQNDAIKKASKILNISSVQSNEKEMLVELIASDFKSTGQRVNKVAQHDINADSSADFSSESPKKDISRHRIPVAILPKRRRFVRLTKDSVTGDITIDEN